MAPNTRSRAYDPSATTLNRDEQLASKKQHCDEEIEKELRLQTETYEHRRRVLRLEAEHELEHRRNMHQLEMEIRKSVNEIELRQCSDKLNMRLKYERASMQFRDEFKRQLAGVAEEAKALAGSEAQVEAPNGVGDHSQAENQASERDESMVL